MNKKISLVFLALAALIVVGVFNWNRISTSLESSPKNEQGIYKKKDLTKSELIYFLDSQAWFDYNSKAQPLSLFLSVQKKTVYIHIWASWCGPCLNEIPELVAYAKANKDNAQFILISLDESQQDIDKFLRSFPEMKEPHFVRIWDYDKKISKKLDVDRLPMTLILSPAENDIRSIRAVVNWKSI